MNEPIAHSGVWILALIMIVIVSWLLYKYLAPKTWREWAGAGVVQAFIIALYAEMYGFPLTIYLLARFGGLDRTGLNANLWSSLLGMGETGMIISMVLGYTLLFFGIGLFFQGWRKIHEARKEKKLVTNGLYALARHPQYTGLFIALFGEGVVHWPTIFSIGLLPIIIYIYYRLSRREERMMIKEFGKEYIEYQKQVPMFIPNHAQWKDFIAQSKASN
jgi:protein-S-isoprenylcysteine O-methyltransferase Ste14